MLEVPAGHTATSITRLRTASQALVMAALALEATRTMLTVVQAHYRKEEGEENREKEVNIRFDTHGHSRVLF